MPSLFKTVGAVLCLVFALSFTAPNAHADTFTYTYTGTTFAIFVSPYTASDGVDGTVVLSAPLPSNAPFADESALLVSYSFTDGVQTLTNLNSTVQNFRFSTNAAGTIFNWQVDVVTGSQAITTFADGIFTGEFGGATGGGLVPHGSTFGVGSWSGPVVATGTPEPSSLALMLSGVGLVFAMRKRSFLR